LARAAAIGFFILQVLQFFESGVYHECLSPVTAVPLRRQSCKMEALSEERVRGDGHAIIPYKHSKVPCLCPGCGARILFYLRAGPVAWKNYWLVKDLQQRIAIVTQVLCAGHGGVAYAYRVNQLEYTGSDGVSQSKGNGLPFSRGDLYPAAVVGEHLVVYFCASHPWLSLSNRPRSMMVTDCQLWSVYGCLRLFSSSR
jgi:hypothetical protein